ncbi:TetR/AcrR family transcriptional regulator [Fusobacterium sp. MFO224]|uniref:TetR/AcrR family transcriptional regulator n=1 Tax=Fusobacterium sp. MFO224 TaxID=3378070 RepID=UPI0038532CE7
MSTKKKILNSTYKLISQKGFEKTSISNICNEVGIQKPSLYYYFKSKDDILFELSDHIINNIIINFNHDIEICKKITEKEKYRFFLINIVERYIKTFHKNKDSQLVFMELYIQSNRIPLLENKKTKLVEIIKMWIENILKEGIKLNVFKDNFDLNLNTDLIFNTLLGIECSYIYNMNIDYPLVWKEIITTLFK